MLRSAKELVECAVVGTDGAIGQVHDLYFDDHAWTVRFLAVKAGTWLKGRSVLISPIAIGEPDWAKRLIPVSVTREQVRKSPDVDCHKPVSRQHEIENYAYYGYPHYWDGSSIWGHAVRPGLMLAGQHGAASSSAAQRETAFVDIQAQARRQRGDDPHLRSVRAMLRYHTHATDGDIGHVGGMLVDVESWTVRSLVVNTSDWWLGHQVLVAPQSIRDVSWLDATVSVDLRREAVKHAPVYDPGAPPPEPQNPV